MQSTVMSASTLALETATTTATNNRTNNNADDVAPVDLDTPLVASLVPEEENEQSYSNKIVVAVEEDTNLQRRRQGLVLVVAGLLVVIILVAGVLFGMKKTVTPAPDQYHQYYSRGSQRFVVPCDGGSYSWRS